jgi:hypothetical protein
MYHNIFDAFQGAKAQLIAAIAFPTPTTKHATIVIALLINILCIVYVRSKGSVSVLIVFNESRK